MKEGMKKGMKNGWKERNELQRSCPNRRNGMGRRGTSNRSWIMLLVFVFVFEASGNGNARLTYEDLWRPQDAISSVSCSMLVGWFIHFLCDSV